MIDSWLELTALPNLHPAVVHFPIAFLPLAWAFDVAGVLWLGQRWLRPAGTTLYVLAAASAWLAVWAGERAADGLVDVPAAVQPRIGEHSDWAHYTLYGLAALAVLRLVVHWREGPSDRRGPRIAVLLAGVLAMAALAKTADLGGSLVYRHALAVERPPSPAEAAPAETGVAEPEPGSPARDRLSETAEGGLVWRPAPGDRDALGDVLEAAPGSRLETVWWVESEGEEGLTLAVDGATTLLFPGTFSDVQVEASVELLDFEGTLGLVHHWLESGDGGLFTVQAGTARLTDLRGGTSKVLDEQAVGLPAGAFALAVSSAGRHLKGLIDGRTVVHGHISPGPPGRCGIRLDGRGELTVVQARVTPLERQ